MIFYAVVVFALGFYLFIGAYKNYDWFFSVRRMKRTVDIMGREGARNFYIVVGIIVMIVAIVLLFV